MSEGKCYGCQHLHEELDGAGGGTWRCRLHPGVILGEYGFGERDPHPYQFCKGKEFEPEAPASEKPRINTLLAAQEQAFVQFVKQNRSLGFGNMMQLISNLWREEDPTGALSVGPCYGLLKMGMQGAPGLAIPLDLARDLVEETLGDDQDNYALVPMKAWLQLRDAYYRRAGICGSANTNGDKADGAAEEEVS